MLFFFVIITKLSLKNLIFTIKTPTRKHTYSEGSSSAAMLMLSPAVAASDWRCGGSARALRSLEPREIRLLSTTHYTCFSCVYLVFAAGSSPKPCDCRCHTSLGATPPPWRMPIYRKYILWARCAQETRCALRDAAAAVTHDDNNSSISTTDRTSWLRACSSLETAAKTKRSKRPLMENHVNPAHQYADTELGASVLYEQLCFKSPIISQT